MSLPWKMVMFDCINFHGIHFHGTNWSSLAFQRKVFHVKLTSKNSILHVNWKLQYGKFLLWANRKNWNLTNEVLCSWGDYWLWRELQIDLNNPVKKRDKSRIISNHRFMLSLISKNIKGCLPKFLFKLFIFRCVW